MPTSVDLTTRLHSDLRNASIAIDGISGVVSPYNPVTVIVSPSNLQNSAQSIINAFDGSQVAQDAWVESQRRAAAASFMDILTENAKAYRAIAALTIDEINSLRQWVVNFKAQVALASNLTDLKTRIATLPNLSDRTLVQAKSAFLAKIESGT